MPAPKEIQTLCQNFRHHLEFFFAHLNLAPPYHTVEKAIAHLTSLLKALPAEKLEETSRDLAQQWEFYQQAFIKSGLNQKHRGIIAGMIRRGEADTLPEEYQPFLKTYLS